MKAIFLVALALFSVPLLVACGDDDDAVSIPADRDDALAQSMLLTVADFPASWVETPRKEQSESPFEECNTDEPTFRTGEASTGTFGPGILVKLSEQIVIWSDGDELRARLNDLDSYLQCRTDLINEGHIDTNDVEYNQAAFAPLSFPRLGDDSRAYYVQFHAQDKHKTGPGSEGTFHIDYIFVVTGRVICIIKASGFELEVSSSLVEDTVHKALAKIVQPQ